MRRFKHHEDFKKLNFFLIGVILGVLTAIILVKISINDINKQLTENNILTTEKENEDNSKDNNEDSDDVGITTYTYEHEVLTGEKQEQAKDLIKDTLDQFKNKSVYFQVQVGDSQYDTYLYNTKGEGFGQSADGQYTAIYRNDNKTIKYDSSSSTIGIGTDIDFLKTLNIAVDLIGNKNKDITLYEMTSSTDSKVREFRIDLVGEQAVRDSYGDLSDEAKDNMLENMKETIDTNWEPHLIYSFIIGENNELTTYCYIVNNDREYANWVCQGYIELDDWELPNEWYSDDSMNLEDTDKIFEMMKSLLEKFEDLIKKYAEENDIDLSAVEDTTEETESKEGTVEKESEDNGDTVEKESEQGVKETNE